MRSFELVSPGGIEVRRHKAIGDCRIWFSASLSNVDSTWLSSRTTLVDSTGLLLFRPARRQERLWSYGSKMGLGSSDFATDTSSHFGGGSRALRRSASHEWV